MTNKRSGSFVDNFKLLETKRSKTAERILSILKLLYTFRFFTRRHLQVLVAGDEKPGYSRRWLLNVLSDLRAAEYIIARKRYYQRKGPDGIVRHIPRQQLAYTLAPEGARALRLFVHPEPRPEDIRRWEDRKDVEHELGVGEFVCSTVLALQRHEDLQLTGLWNGLQVERLLHEYSTLNKIGSPPVLRPDLALKFSSTKHSSEFGLVVEWSTGSEPLRRAGQGALLSSEESKLRRSAALIVDQQTRHAMEAVLGVRRVWFLTVTPDADRARRVLELFRNRVFVPRTLGRRLYRRFLAMEASSVAPDSIFGDVCYRYDYDPVRRWGEARPGYSVLDLIKGRFKKINSHHNNSNL